MNALSLMVHKRSYDFILITETWLTGNNPENDVDIIGKNRLSLQGEAVSYIYSALRSNLCAISDMQMFFQLDIRVCWSDVSTTT